MTSRGAFVAALCAVALLASGAAASLNFPKVVETTVGLAKQPECTLCHQDNKGGENTTTKPFGRTMLRFGAQKKNTDALVAALQKDDLEGTDSDGDCIPDTDELRAGPWALSPGILDPNVVNATDGGKSTCPVPYNPPVLETGCSTAQWGRRLPSTGALIALCLLLVVFRARGNVVGARASGGRDGLNPALRANVPTSKENGP